MAEPVMSTGEVMDLLGSKELNTNNTGPDDLKGRLGHRQREKEREREKLENTTLGIITSTVIWCLERKRNTYLEITVVSNEMTHISIQ